MLAGVLLDQPTTRRPFYEGIDCLRAGAVFLVLWSHAAPLMPPDWREAISAPWFRPGFWGVTIFFAISGFLVIGQLIDLVCGWRAESLKVFVLRRWLRTVPTYWLLLLLLLGVGWLSWPGWSTWLANGLFLQGSITGQPTLLPVAWSLVIEEWSYLAFAAFTLVLVGVRSLIPMDARRTMGVVLLALLLLPGLAGALRSSGVAEGIAVRELKQGLLMQVDALAYGGLLAWFYRRATQRFDAIAQRGMGLFVLLLGVLSVFSLSGADLFRNVSAPVPSLSQAWLTWGFYPIAGCLASALLLSAWQFRYASLPRGWEQPVRILSRCSYSVYLIHIPFAGLLVGMPLPPALKLLLYLIGSIVLGDVCWRLLEQPFMRLRKRLR